MKRLRPVLALDTQWHKTDEELEAAVRKDSGVVVRYDLHSIPIVSSFWRSQPQLCCAKCAAPNMRYKLSNSQELPIAEQQYVVSRVDILRKTLSPEKCTRPFGGRCCFFPRPTTEHV